MARTKTTTKPKTRPKSGKGAEPAASLAPEQLKELLLQALETELGGVQVYETALECASNEDLVKEWEEYLEQTREHVETVEDLCRTLEVDTEQETPGRQVVRSIGEALVAAMKQALEAGDEAAAEIVAAECVTLAESKDHLNWELLGEAAKAASGEAKRALTKAHAKIEEEEDEHLYHSQGWARELWIKALGLPTVLPPPEEKHDVKSASAAEKAKKGRAREARPASEIGA